MSVAKALESRVVLFTGEEEALRRRALAEVWTILGIPQDDFDVEHFAADTSGPAAWAASAGTVPFLAPRRVSVVRHLYRLEPDKALAITAPLATLPPSGLVLLVGDEESGMDDASSKASRAKKAWDKAVEKLGGKVLRFDAEPKKARELVREEAKNLGYKLSAASTDLLVEMTGGSLSRAIEELEKLAIYVGPGGQITEGEIRRLVVPSRDWSVFKITDAVASGNPAEGLRQLRILVSSAARAEETAYRTILPMMSRQLRLMWQARLCHDARCPADRPTPEVARCFPSRPNLASEAPYRQGNLMRATAGLTLGQIGRCLTILSDTDARLKGMLDAYTSMDTLERMVLDMCSVISE